jgi:hypothetical protein
MPMCNVYTEYRAMSRVECSSDNHHFLSFWIIIIIIIINNNIFIFIF